MAAANLLALIDDVATVLDDVSVMTKAAAKKTSGLVGDDLAVNAEQVTGVVAERELPVIWAVAKGATLNKLILIPAALLLSAYAPWILVPLLLCGGGYLAYEGYHKIHHSLFHRAEEAKHKDELRKAFRDGEIDMKEYEKKKVNGAIRTDFILSAEIIVLVLNTVAKEPLSVQIGVLIAISAGVVVFIYGLVAGIVKIDDLGLHLRQKDGAISNLGDWLVAGAPKLIRALGILGTVAMLLVGGGIFAHHISPIEHGVHFVAHSAGALQPVAKIFAEGLTGLLAGAVLLGVLSAGQKLTGTSAAH